jgi:4-amino-4-deoxy-L-arabinose transferase-like glycosyltransferase
MKWISPKLLIIVIVFLAGVLRISHIDTNPPSISWDEASIGYNAYSIVQTGQDEHGKRYPLDTFAAFGDYKPPIAIYLTAPFVALLGPTDLAIRLPSAIAGTITVWIVYLIALALFRSHKHSQSIALWSALFLALSPWHIMLSRAGFEANIAFLWISLGVWLLLEIERIPTLLYICWLPFVLGIYTFNSARYAGPLIALGVAVLVHKALLSAPKKLAWGVIIALITLVPILPHLVSREARLRFEEVSIFTDLRTVLTANARQAVDGGGLLASLVHNRRIGYAREFALHFTDHFEPRYLFISGDGNPKFSIRDTGQLLIISAPFIALGGVALFAQIPAVAWLFVWWMIVSVAPAAVARETPHALRTENILPIWMMITGFGVVTFLQQAWLKKKKQLVALILIVLLAINFGYFWHNLMTHYPKEYSGEWQYGYKDAILLAKRLEKEYDTIVLTESIGRPYIYALLYLQYKPQDFWKSADASFDAAGFYNVYGFGKFRFTREGVSSYSGKVLYILPPKDVPQDAHIVETIRLLNGNPILVAFD